MARDLTIKQRKFIRAYLENNGNGTAAALEAYDTDDPLTAGSIAAENLKKPRIREEIELACESEGIGPAQVAVVLRDGMKANRTQLAVIKDVPEVVDLGPDHGRRLQAAETWGKLLGAFDKPAETKRTAHAHLHLIGELRGRDPGSLRRAARGKLEAPSATTGSGAMPQDQPIIDVEAPQDSKPSDES